MKKLSVTLAVYNEGKFLSKCLDSIKDIADEIVIVDGSSTDNTVAIAKKYKAKILVKNNEPIFHINKQKALDMATCEWVLNMDADEEVSPQLAKEIIKVISMNETDLDAYESNLGNSLFNRHQKAVEQRDGKIGTEVGPYTAFFIPRSNYFLGNFLKHGGVYPDGVIRLVKRGYANFPSKSVHEQMVIDGRVGWLKNDLLHFADKSFGRYINRFNRYTDLEAETVKGGVISNFIWKPLFDNYQGFIFLYFRHLGFLDGIPGFIWALFSSLHFPIAYMKSIYDKKNESRSS